MWLLRRAACFRPGIAACARFISQQSVTPSVWVLTDGGLRSMLIGTALGKRLGNVELKTIVASKSLQMFPPIIQKYIVGWSSPNQKTDALPWYLSTEDTWSGNPDFVVCSAPLAVPACLTLTQPTNYSVYTGFPNIPFLYFDQVVLPKYEAQFKLAKLGPYARQKNMIATNMPLLDNAPSSASKRDHTAVIVGSYSPQCRWYSEDANILAENMRRMVEHLHTNLVVVFTERTTDQVKKNIRRVCDKYADHINVWDAMVDSQSAQDRMVTYQDIIDRAARVVVTADLDYATAHAASRRKPVYVTFGDRTRSHLLHFHRWAREKRITRKLRLDKSRAASRKKQIDHSTDPFSYLGNHQSWADGRRVLEVQETLDDVAGQLEIKRLEKVTGKRHS